MKEKMIIGCILMAAGISERFGCGNKLMADLDGKPLISYPVQTLLSVKEVFDRTDTGISLDLLTVTRWPEVREVCLAAGMPCILYSGGLQSDTIRVGLEAAEDRNWEGCMFLAGDQPLVTAGTIKRLIETFAARPEQPCRAAWQGTAANPVIFPSSYFDALKRLKGDEGGRQVLRDAKAPVSLVEMEDASEMMDIDTMQDYRQVVGIFQNDTSPLTQKNN